MNLNVTQTEQLTESLTQQQAISILNVLVEVLSVGAASASLIITLAAFTVPAWVPIVIMAMKAGPGALKILENIHPIFAKLSQLVQGKDTVAGQVAQELHDWIQTEYADTINNFPTDYNNEVITDV